MRFELRILLLNNHSQTHSWCSQSIHYPHKPPIWPHLLRSHKSSPKTLLELATCILFLNSLQLSFISKMLSLSKRKSKLQQLGVQVGDCLALRLVFCYQSSQTMDRKVGMLRCLKDYKTNAITLSKKGKPSKYWKSRSLTFKAICTDYKSRVFESLPKCTPTSIGRMLRVATWKATQGSEIESPVVTFQLGTKTLEPRDVETSDEGSAESFPQLEWGGGWEFGESGLARFGPFPLSEWDAGHPARG